MKVETRLKALESKTKVKEEIIGTVAFIDKDEDGNLISVPSMVVGPGWRLTREDGETRRDFFARAKMVAAENGRPDLWEGRDDWPVPEYEH